MNCQSTLRLDKRDHLISVLRIYFMEIDDAHQAELAQANYNVSSAAIVFSSHFHRKSIQALPAFQ